MNSKFEIMPPDVQAMILAAADAKVASIIDGASGVRQQAEALIERLSGESKYLREAYQVQVEPQDLRADNPRHIAKLDALKGEAKEKAKDAIAKDVLLKPAEILQILNERHAGGKYAPEQIEKMAVVVKLIGSSKIDYALVKDDNKEEQDGAAAKTLGASLARSVAIADEGATNNLPKKKQEKKIT